MTPAGGRKLGVKYVPTPTLMAGLLGAESHHGVWVLSVEAGSAAAAVGIAQGDVILSINGTPTNDVPDVPAAIQAAPADKPVSISVIHAGNPGIVTVSF
jgi:S1-C subfamily serine protease